MASILPRSAWTDTEPRWARTPLHVQPVGIAVHWPAVRGVIGGDRARVAAQLRAYRDHHVNNKKWPDIGYNYAVDQAGRVWTLAGKRTAAHAASDAYRAANGELYGVLFVIGMDERPTEAALAAFRWLRANELGARLPVQGHQQVRGASTACPGPHLMAAIRAGHLTTGTASTPTAPTPAPKPTPPAPRKENQRMNRIDLRGAAKKTVTDPHMGQLQGCLMNAGYGPSGLVGTNGRPDRRGGPMTRRFIGQLQRKHNTGDGKGNADFIVGPATWAVLLGL